MHSSSANWGRGSFGTLQEVLDMQKQGPSQHSVSVAATIINPDREILLIRRRDTGAWQLPGGVLELGETIYYGLRREVEEETGLLVEPGPLTGVYKNMKLGVVALVFACRSYSGALRATEESSEYRWATPEDVATDVADVFAVRILDSLEEGPPKIRSHDGQRLLD